MSARDVFRRTLPVVRILWAALTGSTLLLLVLSFLVPSSAPRPPEAPVVAVLGAMAIAVAVASFVLPRRLQGAAAQASRPALAPAEPTPTGMSPMRFADPTDAARRAMALGQSPFIVGMALSEGVSLFGFALHMLGAPVPLTVPFFAAGTLLAALRFPRLSAFVTPFEQAHGAAFSPEDLAP